MFVTDPVEPLLNQLKQNPDKNLVLWGLYKVAVSFLLYFLGKFNLLSIFFTKLECDQIPE